MADEVPKLDPQQLVQSMANPELAQLGGEGAENFSATATAAAHKEARKHMDNLNDVNLLNKLFDPRLTQKELQEINDSLSTTVIVKPELP